MTSVFRGLYYEDKEVIALSQRLSRFGRFMIAKGINPEDVARETGLSLGYIYKLRRGDQVPSMKTARKLCRAIGAPISIFDDSDGPAGEQNVAV